MKKSILLVLFFFGVMCHFNAQVTAVDYLIEYNFETQLYDCKIVINTGEATSFADRFQFNSQYTVVVPTGSTVSVETLHNPLENNQNYTGTIPCIWESNSEIYAPELQPDNDFYGYMPNLSPPSAYNNLVTGDTVTLFSLNIDVDPCENSVRPFRNGVDLTGGFPPGGGDFSNGFTIGGPTQDYNGNLETIYDNFVSLDDSISLCLGECVEFNPTLDCIESDTIFYEWSTGDTTAVIEVCPDSSQHYYLLLKDSMDVLLDSLTVYVDVFDLQLTLMDTIICANTSTVISSNVPGGTFLSTNPSVATIDPNTGVITGDSEGVVVIQYNAPNGCIQFSDFLQVIGAPEVEVPEIMCIGSTITVSSNSEGFWYSGDPTIAVMSIDGNLEAVDAGIVDISFVDTSTMCESVVELAIVETQEIINTGSDSLCVDGTTNLLPSEGGFWALTFSTGPSVASISATGTVTALGLGKAVFSFISDAPGCGAVVSDTIFIVDPPAVEILGSNILCKGDTSSILMLPNTVATSLNPQFLSIDSLSGFFTAKAQGTVTIALTDTVTGCIGYSEPIAILENPFIYAPKDSLCVGELLDLTIQSTLGTWESLDPGIAIIDSSIVEAIASGEARFLFTSDNTGCTSDTFTIKVNPLPIFELTGPDTICLYGTTTAMAESAGQWVVDDPSTLTFTNSGVITSLATGTHTITFIDDATQCTASIEIHVLDPPFTIEPNFDVCKGENLDLFPTNLTGTWESSDSNVVCIDSISGAIETKNAGSADLIFLDANTGCETSVTIDVNDPPIAILEGDSILCIGETTMVNASSFGGTWLSADPSVITINSFSGEITAVSDGVATVNYTDPITGCVSNELLITVLEPTDPACLVNTKEIVDVSFHVYPNPFNNILTIESETQFESISIFNLNYQKLQDINFDEKKSSTQISTDNLLSGHYIIALKANGKTHYRKLIKE